MRFSRGALLVAVCLIAAFAVASAADAKPNRKLLGEKAADCYGWYCGGRGRNWNRGPWNRGWNGGFYPSWGGSYYPVYGGGWSQASASAQAGSFGFGGGFSSANAFASANAGGWGRR
ncbi:hypothetical protein MNEG_7361 [Monoraphidium neglectum]|uniref:Uncharacterized protein n=1 Tax=Monoraphidium neglectum TaxID=145388 RepID=A0A0D2JN63_9CHLO|nr:hypothetical protein MNEG_7361 [Monoraphidium neglectum]KIZ00603.1 hypothetical protein MNEG_7361 [Monoraphidium neglectum]|eukprot:XP_013899622.1 hypothetical protein MNEG_7361 [Monoraphidium neglectum]